MANLNLVVAHADKIIINPNNVKKEGANLKLLYLNS
jgi:hypothetical protein